jgi:hypothetical protein
MTVSVIPGRYKLAKSENFDEFLYAIGRCYEEFSGSFYP